MLAPVAGAHVLLVGSYHGIQGKYHSIQSAVNAAGAGDWILIGPGDYNTSKSSAPAGFSDRQAGVLITKANLRIRGMNRNSVIVDGTKPGTAPCASKRSAQNFGPRGNKGAMGLNGLMVWKANNVWIQNLTACNFLGGTGDAGNEIWWNGGDGGGQIGGWGYKGSYLTTTSSFYGGESTAAAYGVFSSDWSGGTWDHAYASNFNDSGFYIGACQQVCNQTVDQAWAQFNALGYSGSNSGGRLVIKNSEFDNNEDGFDTNSQNGDNPSPQNGACPNNGVSPITHTHSCWVFMHNYVHDNNNPNVPSQGTAAAGPVGTGMSVSGGRNDTVMDNRFANNNAWGVIFVPYSDSGAPCTGGTLDALGPGSCLFDEWGDSLIGNTFRHNGSFGHPSNGDFAQLNLEGGHPAECYRGNTAGGVGLTADSAVEQRSHRDCGGQPASVGSSDPQFMTEVLCDSQVMLNPGVPSPCPAGQYPRRQAVIMHRLPRNLATMPDPCAGVPANPWCTARGPRHSHA